MTAPDLAAFLLARYAERETQAPHVHLDDCAWVYVDYITGDGGSECDCGVPARVLADCAALRAIVALHEATQTVYSGYGDGARDTAETVLMLMAQPFAAHPDFYPGWRV